MTKLYALSEVVRDQLEQAEEAENPEVAFQLLQEIQGDLETKLEWVALRVLELKRQEEAQVAEAKRLRDEASTSKRQADWLKEYIGLCLERAKLKRVDGRLVKVRRQKSPASVLLGKALEVAIEIGSDLRKLLPAKFVRVIPERTEVDKQAIMSHFKETGEKPEGVEIDDSRETVVVW